MEGCERPGVKASAPVARATEGLHLFGVVLGLLVFSLAVHDSLEPVCQALASLGVVRGRRVPLEIARQVPYILQDAGQGVVVGTRAPLRARRPLGDILLWILLRHAVALRLGGSCEMSGIMSLR